MTGRGRLFSGGLFVRRPRSVTVGLGIAGAMAGIGLLYGFSMLLGDNFVYTGLGSFHSLPMTDHSRTQGLVVLGQSLIFLTAVGRALRPSHVARYITIGFCGLTGVLLALEAGTVNFAAITAFTPALLLMTHSASEYYGD